MPNSVLRRDPQGVLFHTDDLLFLVLCCLHTEHSIPDTVPSVCYWHKPRKFGLPCLVVTHYIFSLSTFLFWLRVIDLEICKEVSSYIVRSLYHDSTLAVSAKTKHCDSCHQTCAKFIHCTCAVHLLCDCVAWCSTTAPPFREAPVI